MKEKLKDKALLSWLSTSAWLFSLLLCILLTWVTGNASLKCGEKHCKSSSIQASAQCKNLYVNVKVIGKDKRRQCKEERKSWNHNITREQIEDGWGMGGRRGPDEGTMRGGPTSKPYLSSIHSYLGKEGFALHGRDRKMERGWGGEMRRRGGPLKGGGGMEGQLGDKDKNRSRGKRGRFIIKKKNRWVK